jgi:hypothetical protein
MIELRPMTMDGITQAERDAMSVLELELLRLRFIHKVKYYLKGDSKERMLRRFINRINIELENRIEVKRNEQSKLLLEDT